ncbi:SMP-30/gluconolactonase/LRE family protein [Cryptosporangium minutisporangium]|uniref:SMP-30/gluconolactonase/LRE family protein n=1 Tax=Cryptosporangium minutisporangium TaxID=113569 RepID=A0ABP6T1A8_9ACTN
MIAQPKELLNGLVVGESPRWHDGRLWFSNWGAQEIVTLTTDGTAEVVGRGPKPAGYCLDWLPDGRLLVTGETEVLRRADDGSWTTHVDVAGSAVSLNEIVVDGRGFIYLTDVGFAFGEEDYRPGAILLVTPDGAVRRVAEDIAFGNGMVVTPDNRTLVVAESWANRLTAFDLEADGSLANRRVWAEVGGDGICLDAEGAIWCASVTETGTVATRVAEGGAVLDRIDLDTACFACMLGGPQGRTLYLMVAEWLGVERMGELFTSQTGRVLATEVTVPVAPRP